MDAVIVDQKGRKYEVILEDDLTGFQVKDKVKDLKKYRDLGYITLKKYLKLNKINVKREDDILRRFNIKRLYMSFKYEKPTPKRQKKILPWVENPYYAEIEALRSYGVEYRLQCRLCKNACKKLDDDRPYCPDWIDLEHSNNSVYRDMMAERVSLTYEQYCERCEKYRHVYTIAKLNGS